MSQISYFLAIVFFLSAAWLGWRYFDLKRHLDEYTKGIRDERRVYTGSKNLEGLSKAITALKQEFDSQISTVQKQNARLSTILDQLTDGVLIADSDGRVQFANPAICRLFDTTNPISASVAQVLRSHQLIEAWRRCQETREMQVENVSVSLRKQFLQVIVIPDKHEGGSLIIAQDMTQARKLETVRRDFISNVSHELRTPLASLKALTETLQSGALLDLEAGPRFLERIHTEVDALSQMTQELLDLSRIESGQVQLNFEPLSPRKLIHSAAERMKAQVERARLKLDVYCEDGLPNIMADRNRLEQVLVNLIHNAVKFNHPGGSISLGVESIPGGVRCAVRDTGSGIPAESLTRIFERFYRVDSSRTGSGTGLGLSISKHIIEAHGGKIWAESEEGRGSSFFFELPTNKNQ